MFRAARWNDDAAEAARRQCARDLAHRLPEKFRVLEGLAGHDNVGAFGFDLAPVIRIAQDDIDVWSRGQVHADIFPRRQHKERAVTSVDVLAAEIENDERLRPARFEIIAPEDRHLVERAWVHGFAVNPARPPFATALSEKRLAFSA